MRCFRLTDACMLAIIRLTVCYSPSSKQMNQGVSLIHPSAFSAPTPWPAVQARAVQLRRTRYASPVSTSVKDAYVNNKKESAMSARYLAGEMCREMRIAQSANGSRCAQTPPFASHRSAFALSRLFLSNSNEICRILRLWLQKR